MPVTFCSLSPEKILRASNSCNIVNYMKSNNSFSVTLHLLLHLEKAGTLLTSEQMSAFTDSNPAFIRKILAGLRENNIVCSIKGHHGGWKLCRPINSITLYEIYAALGSPSLFAIGNRNDNPACLIEKGVNRAMDGTLLAAETLILDRFKALTLQDISDEFIGYFDREGKAPW